MTVEIKSNKVVSGNLMPINMARYVSRVKEDGGEVVDIVSLREIFDFVALNSIQSTHVGSLTSAAWGIKKTGAAVSKLYNLFGSSGDLELIAGALSFVGVGADSPSVLFPGTQATRVRSKAAVNTSNNVGVAVAYKSVTNTEPTINSTLGSLQKLDATKGASINYTAGTSGSTKLGYRANAWGTSGGINSTKLYENYAAVACDVSDAGFFLRDQTGVVGSDLVVTNPGVLQEYYAFLGVQLATSTTYQFAANGYIKEAWFFNDLTVQQLDAILQRIHTKYGGA